VYIFGTIHRQSITYGSISSWLSLEDPLFSTKIHKNTQKQYKTHQNNINNLKFYKIQKDLIPLFSLSLRSYFINYWTVFLLKTSMLHGYLEKWHISILKIQCFGITSTIKQFNSNCTYFDHVYLVVSLSRLKSQIWLLYFHSRNLDCWLYATNTIALFCSLMCKVVQLLL